MFKSNITLPTKSVSADADLGIAAVGSSSQFALTASLDNQKTVRRNTTVGDITVAHSDSKEFGGASKRHVLRVDLKQNGNIPAASAYVVIAHPDTQSGITRSVEAFHLLLLSVLKLAQDELVASGSIVTALGDEFDAAIANADGKLIIFPSAAGGYDISVAFDQGISRIAGNEG